MNGIITDIITEVWTQVVPFGSQYHSYLGLEGNDL